MIAASEPLEFIPRGRQAVNEHPGPLTTKCQVTVPSEHLLLHRLQNVTISNDDEFMENWSVREICQQIDETNDKNEIDYYINKRNSRLDCVNDKNSTTNSTNNPNNMTTPSDTLLFNSDSNTSSRSVSPMLSLNEILVNSEEELYVKGYTAVWSNGQFDETTAVPHVCLTCETPIKFAFFCPNNFITIQNIDRENTENMSKQQSHKFNNRKRTKFKINELDEEKEIKNLSGIGLIDSTSIRVYCNNGEDYITSLEFPVSNVWTTKFGVLLEKKPQPSIVSSIITSSTLASGGVDRRHHVGDGGDGIASSSGISTTVSSAITQDFSTNRQNPLIMPHLFSLGHPLDDICPVLLKSTNNFLNYFNENDFKVIFACETSYLVLLYDNKISKHFIAKLRLATQIEKNIVCGPIQSTSNDTTSASGWNFSSIPGLFSNSANNSAKLSNSAKFVSPLPTKTNTSTGGANINNSNQIFSPRLVSPHIQTSVQERTQQHEQQQQHQHQHYQQHSYQQQYQSHTQPQTRQQHQQQQSLLARLHSTIGGNQSFTVQDMRKIGQAHPSKPIIPRLILERIWTENTVTQDYCEIASDAFIHIDLIGQAYICYLLTRTSILNFVRIEKSNDPDIHIFGMATNVSAKDAVCLPKMKMIAVLDLNGTLLLYSGPILIGKVHVGGTVLTSYPNVSHSSLRNSFCGTTFPRRSSLLPTIQSTKEFHFDEELHMISPVHPLQTDLQTKFSSICCSSLRDPTGNRLTLMYPDGKMFRISLPLISECPFVSKCLAALRQVLNKDLALQLISKWYNMRNVPGSQDYNPKQEWLIFQNVLLELLGRPLYNSDNGLAKNQFDTTADEPKKRRKSENCDGNDSDWEFLVNFLNQSKILPNNNMEEELMPSSNAGGCTGTPVSSKKYNRNDINALLFPHIPLVFSTFHLLYEDMKLNTIMKNYLQTLAEFLYQLALDLQLDNYCLHYFLDYPHLAYINSSSFVTESESKKLLNQHYIKTEVPNIFKYIYAVINRRNHLKRYPIIRNVNKTSKTIIQLIQLIYPESSMSDEKTKASDDAAKGCSRKIFKDKNTPLSQTVVQALIDLKITRSDLKLLPTAIHYLIADIIEAARLDTPIDSNAKVYELLLRPDLFAHTKFSYEAEYNELNLTFKNVRQENSLSPRIPPIPDVITKSELAEDGMEHIDTKLFHLRFPEDLRINEVRRMLSSSNPVTIDIVQSPGVNDHDFLEEQERQLYSICTRTMALPIGRGMFTLRTCTPASTESLTIPKLCLLGKENLKGATIDLTHMEVAPNMNMWPSFHNGVAAGLQISPESKDIDSTWIVYNKPKSHGGELTEHAGFLMALGLNGHLRSLSFMSMYEYLVKCDEMTSIGLLLGISAAHRGTMDTTTTKLLSVHIEALLPATALELDIPQNIQIAAIMGVGLIYQGTAKRHIAEVLLQEIGRPPGPEMENCVERESYALTAGLALGLVTLGQGESPTGLRDLQLPDTLHYYMIGGNKRPLTGSQKEKYKLPSFQVREGDTVNIDVTEPGATLALGLMFFNTGNTSVAHWMKPPDTYYLLDLVRPDLLLLRIIARGLILWDDIKPTNEWIFGQFPESLAFDLNVGPSANEDGIEIDDEAICQAYCNIIAGASVCMGLRYAGTENKQVYETLTSVLRIFLNMGTQYIGTYAGKATIEACLVLILLSLSLVFAGSGHLTILKLCRMLRSRLGSSTHANVTYGSHIAIHMALGFLFLGGGRYTLSRSPEAIAALVCTLFPKFPTHSNDNRYHLQAFRHLYVLAIEPRLFIPRDIDSGKLCLADITIKKIGSDETIQLVAAPCMLPELNSIESVTITDQNYWQIRFEKGKNWSQLVNILTNCGCIDIKKKAGCLSMLEDPDRFKSYLARTLTTEQYKCWKVDSKLLLSFSNDPKVTNFTNKFLTIRESSQYISETMDELKLKQMLTLLFYDCLTQDKMHALPIYMNLIMTLENKSEFTSYDVWQFKLLNIILTKRYQYQLASPVQSKTSPPPSPQTTPFTKILPSTTDNNSNNRNNNRNNELLSIENLNALTKCFITNIEKWLENFNNYLKQFLFSSTISYLQETDMETLQKLSVLITYYDLPINILNLIELGGCGSSGELNYIRMINEFKRFNLEASTMHCIEKLLNSN